MPIGIHLCGRKVVKITIEIERKFKALYRDLVEEKNEYQR